MNITVQYDRIMLQCCVHQYKSVATLTGLPKYTFICGDTGVVCRVAVERSAVLLHPVILAQFFPSHGFSISDLPSSLGSSVSSCEIRDRQCVEHHREVLHAAIYGSVIDSSFCFLLVRSQSRDLTLLQRHWGISCLKEEERCGFLSFQLPNILSFHSFLSMKYPKPLSNRVNTKSQFVNTLKSEISRLQHIVHCSRWFLTWLWKALLVS